MDPQTEEAFKRLDAVLQRVLQDAHAWNTWEYWLALLIGVAGLYFAWKASREAHEAKQAATEAGRTVKIQTVTIELTEVAQKLERIHPDIKFSEARDLLSEISRRVRRVISPFEKDPDLEGKIKSLREALDATHSSLSKVRPSGQAKETEVPQAVYYAIESDFATLTNVVAELLGLFEKKGIDFGDAHAGR